MTALAATLHDPDGRLRAQMVTRLHWLDHYTHAVIVCTDQTEPHTIECLESHSKNVTVLTNPAAQIGESRRMAMRTAINSGADSVLYCDFDRWLHWVGVAPQELTMLLEHLATSSPRPWYVCVGRTARAFNTHPRVQQVTEALSNGVLSSLIEQDVDATAGCCWLSELGARLILQHSQASSNATDLEWPAIVHDACPGYLGNIRVEGLEFETGEFFADEIDNAGSMSAWITQRYGRTEVWLDRMDLALESIRAALRILSSEAREK